MGLSRLRLLPVESKGTVFGGARCASPLAMFLGAALCGVREVLYEAVRFAPHLMHSGCDDLLDGRRDDLPDGRRNNHRECHRDVATTI